ncbi:hypothetical protein COY43_03045 [Candidatus Berkelbacteria bacterium CG_4_10_14_0_8_um_filter_35_9_33_8]|uniref:Uncharacterized protein n=1 Tax=Candidatus Berkelbacteria bacterium CG_4_10_14_0_2_um_filter_35_9_33_12 TaxID=1974499 RepID=A0A2M7W4P2_9BACT|nr:MAG: hypothetical protein COX10_00230 [Candidatus Berkelbacteria bacterium CG23_combo_of_CG06-09_8_20_14_all_33_15]PIZ27968.1 MAG: hypothetical protein COY43_03045 [Candidatus Berkelbacteria bacterium CG_4_10_14_0_8_um_filter_35_9_33_8]PJA20782.1 MAG: hypothetical protein COX60_00865 [Candidatus Berkelbacteria bacterium CG_4_10_14_0_2_um_filter_35_9_33_12]PJB51253.1 MAG: hypothetical protein CO100_02340 [Candidatus Berkelbacteria bacterium CG_4_9_14_3_um_filter_33_5]
MYTLQEMNEKIQSDLNKFDNDLMSARKISNDAIYKIIWFSASIIGFTITIISIPKIETTISLDALQISWFLFLAVIIIGLLIVTLEGRIEYAIYWKGFQLQNFDGTKGFTKTKQLAVAFIISIITILYPRNLISKNYKIENKNKFYSQINRMVISQLNYIKNVIFILENILIIILLFGLFYLIKSY